MQTLRRGFDVYLTVGQNTANPAMIRQVCRFYFTVQRFLLVIVLSVIREEVALFLSYRKSWIVGKTL